MSTDELFTEVFNGGKLVGKAIGALDGEKTERERILLLWEAEMSCLCEEPMQHLARLIKAE